MAWLLAPTSHVHCAHVMLLCTVGKWNLPGFCDVLWHNFHSVLCDSGTVASQLEVIHTHTHTHTQTHTHTHTHTHTSYRLSVGRSLCVCLYVSVYLCVCVCTLLKLIDTAPGSCPVALLTHIETGSGSCRCWLV